MVIRGRRALYLRGRPFTRTAISGEAAPRVGVGHRVAPDAPGLLAAAPPLPPCAGPSAASVLFGRL